MLLSTFFLMSLILLYFAKISSDCFTKDLKVFLKLVSVSPFGKLPPTFPGLPLWSGKLFTTPPGVVLQVPPLVPHKISFQIVHL